MWKDIFKIMGVVLVLFTSAVILGSVVRSCEQGRKATHIDDAVIVYEEFQEIYNTCEKLNVDIGNMKSLPEEDKMFEQFSKAQRVNTLKTQLNKWVEIYNSKSKMWGRALWKSDKLPYQLSVNEFSNYN